jgi:hypothetical protein
MDDDGQVGSGRYEEEDSHSPSFAAEIILISFHLARNVGD